MKMPYSANFQTVLQYNKEIFEKHYNELLNLVIANAVRHYCRHNLLLPNEKGEYFVNFDSGYMCVKMNYLPAGNNNYRLNISVSAKIKKDLEAVKNSIEKKVLGR